MGAQEGVGRGRRGGRKGLRGWVTTAVGALVLALIPAPTVHAAGTGSITGTVTGAGGAGVANVVVHAWVLGSSPMRDGWATTAADGTYTITGLEADDYVVNFRTGDFNLPYVNAYHPDVFDINEAVPVEVGSGPVTGIDAALTLGATISGTVTDETGPITDATVNLFRQDGTVGSAAQGLQPGGVFEFRRLPAGTYVLRTSGTGYRTEFYDDATSSSGATLLTLTAGETRSGLSVSLMSVGSISGTVTTEQGAPIAGMPLQAWVPGRGDFYGATTAADGTYTISGVPAGEYLLQFQTWAVPGHADQYVNEWWNDSRSFATATRLVLTPGEHRTGVDADLELAASISGTVRNGLGAALPGPGTTVYATSTTTSWTTTASPNASGDFTLAGLPAGTYRILTMSTGHPTEYYDDVLDDPDDPAPPASATLVTVTNGQAVTGLQIEMEWLSGIRGTVRDHTDQPMAGVTVTLAGAAGLRTVTTAADGTYEASVPPGAYTVTASSTDPLYPAAVRPGQVHVTTDTWASGVDITMVPYGTITGTVTDPTGAPVADAGVTATSTGTGWASSASTGPDGTYTIYVDAGSYVVDVVPPDATLLPEYYDDATAGTADPVAVTAGETTGGVDVELAWAATFTDVVEGQAFFREITWLAGAGITTGHPDGSFRPAAPVTREAMAAFLHRFAGGGPADDPTPVSFSDVGAGNPFHDDIAWLAQEGITTGWPDGSFRPAAQIERQAMAAFLYRFAGSPSFTPPAESPFVDVRPGDPFYLEICWLADAGITTGTATPSGTYFKPRASVERQAMAAFLYRFARY